MISKWLKKMVKNMKNYTVKVQSKHLKRRHVFNVVNVQYFDLIIFYTKLMYI
jgi:hypothetical protein